MLAYPFTSVPLTFAHSDGYKISTDKSTLSSKLEVRIITDVLRNLDGFIFDGMYLVHSHVDLPSTFGSDTNVTTPRLAIRANHEDFACDTYKYQAVWYLER